MKHQKNILETEVDKQLDNLFVSAGKKHAPEDFTQRLMQKIERGKAPEFVYKPVISKTGWMVIGVVTTAVLLIAIFMLPHLGSTPVVIQKRIGIIGFQFSEVSLLHFQNRLLQILSGSQVLLSILAVAIVVGWHYLFMHAKQLRRNSKFPGLQIF